MNGNGFDPASVSTFAVTRAAFDPSSNTLRLEYGFDEEMSFVETITFTTPASFERSADQDAALARAVHLLHAIAGVSYYKCAAPRIIQIQQQLGDATRREIEGVYGPGLHEFAAENGFTLPFHPVVESEVDQHEDLQPADLPDRWCIPLGGGKDSLVALEALKDTSPLALAINPRPWVVAQAERAGVPLVSVTRTLDPLMMQVSGNGGLNGHIPVTAVNTAIAVVGAYLYGYSKIGLAIESSASEPTRFINDVPVNHQWSKSREAEVLMQDALHEDVDPGLYVGSVLRGFTELAITRKFASLPQYHDLFVSCNHAYRKDVSGPRWCGECPKCRFIALMCAPYCDREHLTGIFQRSLLDDPLAIPAFRSLITEDKPYECVGERRESAYALMLLAQDSEWKDSPVVHALSNEAKDVPGVEQGAELLEGDPQYRTLIPESSRIWSFLGGVSAR
ncbi:MAG: endonuclease domain-containing protein [Candidatus Dormibacteria bacterium]